MTTPFLCVFVTFLLIYLPKAMFSVGMARQPGGYDDHNPREQQAQLRGWAKRATAAHLNAFEDFAPFAAAVVVAHLAGADAHWSAILAATHVAARAVYPFIYLPERLGHVRSVVWTVGFGTTAALFVLPWIVK